MQQVANDFIGIIGFGHNRILIRDGIILAGATRHSDTLSGHYFESDQAERLVTAVRQGRISSVINRTHKFFGEEETQVINISRTRMRHNIETLLQVRSTGRYILDLEADIISVAQHIGPVWLDTTTHKECDRVTAVFQACYGLDSHHPTLIGVEASNLKEEEVAWIALVGNLLQPCHCCWIDRIEVAPGDTIGDHQRIHAILPQPVFHIFAYRTDGAYKAETPPVNPMQRHQAIEIPQYQGLLAHTEPAHYVRCPANCFGRLPVLAHDDNRFALG